MDRTAIILQARMGSRRLPGKTLMTIGTQTVLEHCITRLDAAGLPLIVATTTRTEDDAVEAEARRGGAQVFRGDTDDVLQRYIVAARTFEVTRIVRATGDNPLVDADGPQRVIELAKNVRVDHVVESGLPIGAAVEVVSLSALERAADLITDRYDREHVTSFIRRDQRFQSLRAMAPRHLRRPGLRLTVDTAEDLEFVRSVLESFESPESTESPESIDERQPTLAEVIKAADAHLMKTIVRQRIQRGA